ncbi:MAG: GTP cyclohydrolase I FolE [Lachnospiraceae bacterium]|jgi:GTP cyclohydrolase I|nr:GTP cyclohydrolase I FolE [Lachnospiraceae bacterium]MCR5425383.1 GTP cyclohydrolase I FolE [Lachnospiraceae bacterium]
MDQDKIREGVRLILEGIGEDPSREGLVDTPERISRMYQEICGGYTQSAQEHLSKTFTVGSSELVMEKDIPFYSLCEHHMLPFFGKVAIAYIPNGKVVGISKLARTVEVYARRLQIQENMTGEIADAIMEYLHPQGVMVCVQAEHLCMTMRGIKKPGAQTVTTAARGCFDEDPGLRSTFLQLLG